MSMNRENLQRMADYIKTVPQEKFAINMYRGAYKDNGHECNTLGCVIGHCTILDKNPLPIMGFNQRIDFGLWSEGFTGIDVDEDEWKWCFDGDWDTIDNTPTGAAKRIEWLLNNGLPENWEQQMSGEKPLCYNS